MSMNDAISRAVEKAKEGFVECPAVSWYRIWYRKKEQKEVRDWLTGMASTGFNEWRVVKANQT